MWLQPQSVKLEEKLFKEELFAVITRIAAVLAGRRSSVSLTKVRFFVNMLKSDAIIGPDQVRLEYVDMRSHELFDEWNRRVRK